MAETFSREELERYSRHLLLPDVGLAGQEKLKKASVLIAGAGGLGSPLLLYLAAAGVGKIGIVDFDLVEDSNLQRQVIFSVEDVGGMKAEKAAMRARNLNPHIDVVPFNLKLSSTNALGIIREFDLVADATDNFPTRYLLNDACVLLRKPLVHGSIFRFDGQASVFGLAGGPCYRCIYPSPPPPGLVPDCAEGGVLGVLPGIIGTLQAVEAIKLILGTGKTLSGRLLILDTWEMTFREMKIRRNTACPVCGDNPTITSLIDYDEFCDGRVGQTESIPEISVSELSSRIERGDKPFILDVREQFEYDICNLGGYLIPLNDLDKRLAELDSSKEIVIHCKTGRRSKKAAEMLSRAGFKNVKNLRGGIRAWSEEIDSSLPVY